ncbi:mannose-6-phosphate isomerase, class I [Paenarthrobacter sp. NPDC092416]|uniref:mannose-6-phosphate isomerase, class I n=1 Tax=Paenarthrobacter sp. NPDC092416 TaxID=3364386 RepID=UPI003815F17A
MYKLKNTIRDYAWGSTTLISDYLGTDPSGAPEAEMWLGAHAGSPSSALREHGAIPLDRLISADPDRLLGTRCREAFGDRLPFLMKLLAAGSPLSLQVHPSNEQAAAGFVAEEAAGVPLEAAHRNYKDAHHKPEMILALTPIEALCGFRPAAEAASIFGHLAGAFREVGTEVPPVLEQVRDMLDGGGEPAAVGAAFALLIRGGISVVDAVESVAGILRLGIPVGPFAKELATALELSEAYPGDPGVLISLMLNRVSLTPGQAVFLPSGNIHAYLSGLGIEVMASSDNVLRGGLTAKHIDTDELLNTVDFSPLPVPLLEAFSPTAGVHLWQPPFDEFVLQRMEVVAGDDGLPLTGGTPSILLVVSGSGRLSSTGQSLSLNRGDSVFVSANEDLPTLHGIGSEPLVAFAATVPLHVTAAR